MSWCGPEYERRFADLAAAGHDIHGEATLVTSLLTGIGEPDPPSIGRATRPSVLDAGCGTGRVAIELDRRGIETVGVDVDTSMLSVARSKAPQLTWIEGDLASVAINRTFDAVVMAGNVMIFVTPGTEGAVIESLVRHLRPGGLLIAGFTLRLPLERYDELCDAAGLGLQDRWATWDRKPYEGGDYAVSVHRASPLT